MKSISFLLLAFLSASVTGRADEEKITTELITISIGGGVPACYFRNKDKITKLDVSAQGFGAAVRYHGPLTLSLFKDPAELAPPASGKPMPEPFLRTPLPVGEDRILLVFTNGRGSPTGLRAFGISTNEMKAGDYRIFNFSGRNAYVVMNDEKNIVQPGKPADVSCPEWRSGTLDMEVRFGLSEDQGLRQVYSSVWGHRASRRTFLFILDRADEFNPFEIRRYHDVLPMPVTHDANAPGAERRE